MEVVTYPHPALLNKTARIDEVTDEIREKAQEMLRLMHESDGVGLAAPQVAWSKRVLVLNSGNDPANDEVLINPVIKKRRGRAVAEEGCLSFPDIFVQVERATEIDLEFTDLDGKTRIEPRSEFNARIIQHEIDHLDNILLIHRMSPADRIRLKQEIASLTNS